MKKKGQVTLFLVVGLIIILLVTIFLNNHSEPINVEQTSAKHVKNFVEQCLTQATEDAARDIAQRGGYHELPALSTKMLTNNVPYYHYNGADHMPTREQIEENIATSVEKQVMRCLNFTQFNAMIQTEGAPKAYVTMHKDGITVKLTYMIHIQKEEAEVTIEQFLTTIPSPLLAFYEQAKKIVETHKNSNGYACLSCLQELNGKTGLKTKTAITSEGFVYALEEEKKENDKNIVFKFAVK